MERPPARWPVARVLARHWIFAGYPIAHWQHHDAEAGPAWRAVVFVSLFDLRQFKFYFILFGYFIVTYFYRQPQFGAFGECRDIHHCPGCLCVFSGLGDCTAIIFSCVGSNHTRADPHDWARAPRDWSHA